METVKLAPQVLKTLLKTYSKRAKKPSYAR